MRDEIQESSEYDIRDITCPVCEQENASFITHLLDIPYYKDFLMVNINCPDCGYRSTDFQNTQTKGHTVYRYRIDQELDNTTKVIRATQCTVSIPELGISIEPVGDGSSWIRNVEGILEDIKDRLYFTLKRAEDDHTKHKIKQRIRSLKQMSKNKIPFSIVVDDPTGNSLILPANQNKLEKEIRTE